MGQTIRNFKRRGSRLVFLTRKAVHQSLKYGRSPNGAKLHVFVAGVQRSGTNMAMDVLERSLETAVFHETDRRAFSNYIMRDTGTIHGLASRNRAPVFVIKALCESQKVRGLMEEFPPAKTIWVFRHFTDVVNSMLRSFQKHAIHILRIAEDRESADWRGQNMSDETHTIIQRFARPELENPTAAALMWYLRNVLYFDQGLDMDPGARLVHYDSLVSEPETEFRQLFDFLGLEYSNGLIRDVHSASVGRRPPPAIDGSVERLCEDLYARLVDARKARSR